MKLPTSALLAAAACLTVGAAHATEGGEVRTLLGVAGVELTTPQPPGWYGQVFYQSYSADKFKGNNGETVSVPVPGAPPGVSASLDAKVRADVGAARLVNITEQRVADGQLGFAVTVPFASRNTTTTLTGQGLAPYPGFVQNAVNAGLAQQSAALSGSNSGVGDIEFTSFVDWQMDASRVIGGLSLVAPTGQYDKSRPVNIGQGNFWTVRPVLALAKVWENGWEASAFNTLSFNTRNKDTDVKSGTYAHSDLSLLYRLSEQWRVGAQGYWLQQLSKDEGPGVAADGNKVRVAAIGPSVSYLSESGNYLADVKLMQEFGARNRPQGTSLWVRLQMRFN